MRRVGRGERGAATVEVVLLFPAMILMVWIALGAGMYHWGRTAALNAAQTGAAAAAQSLLPQGHGQCILVVEDETAVRTAVAALLEALQHTLAG